MNDFFRVKSSIYFIRNLVWWIFIFIAGFLLGLGVNSASALEIELDESFDNISIVNIDESKIDLTNRNIYVFQDSDTSSNWLSIFILSVGDKFIYNNGKLYTSKGFHYFYIKNGVYDSSISYYGSSWNKDYSKFKFYYQSEKIDVPTIFPDVTSGYNSVLEKFSDSTSQDNILFTINTFKELFDDMPFLILYNKSWGIQILYTPNGTNIYGDGVGSTGGSDTFNWRAENGTIYKFDGLGFKHFDTVTHSEITTALNSLKDDIDNNNISTNQSFGSSGPQADFVPIYHSEVDLIYLKDPQWTITWNGTSYPGIIPTLNSSLKVGIYIFDDTVDVSQVNAPTRLKVHFDNVSVEKFIADYSYGVNHNYINAPWVKREDDVWLLDQYCSSGDSCYGQYEGRFQMYTYSSTSFDLYVDIPFNSIVPATRKNISIHFEFNIPFTYEYIYENRYTNIDFQGKYGVAFFPKMKISCNSDDKTDIYGTFYYHASNVDWTNTAAFQVARYNSETSSFDVIEEPESYDMIVGSDHVLLKFDHKFTRNQLSDILIIRNPLYLDNPMANIDYDSSLFDYQILDTEFDLINYTNPNTCENIISSLPPSINDSVGITSSNFFDFLGDLIEPQNTLYTMFSSFFNTLFVGKIKTIFMIMFTIFIIVLITSIVRRD